jgi:hypothetical protein
MQVISDTQLVQLGAVAVMTQDDKPSVLHFIVEN